MSQISQLPSPSQGISDASGTPDSVFYRWCKSVDVFLRRVSTLFTTTASLNIPITTAPAAPVNGDIWFDGTNIKIRIGGVTKTFTVT